MSGSGWRDSDHPYPSLVDRRIVPRRRTAKHVDFPRRCQSQVCGNKKSRFRQPRCDHSTAREELTIPNQDTRHFAETREPAKDGRTEPEKTAPRKGLLPCSLPPVHDRGTTCAGPTQNRADREPGRHRTGPAEKGPPHSTGLGVTGSAGALFRSTPGGQVDVFQPSKTSSCWAGGCRRGVIELQSRVVAVNSRPFRR